MNYLDFEIGFPDGKIITFIKCPDGVAEMTRQVKKGSEKERRLKNNLRAIRNFK